MASTQPKPMQERLETVEAPSQRSRGATAQWPRSAWLSLAVIALGPSSCGTPTARQNDVDAVTAVDSTDGSADVACDGAPHVLAVAAPLDGAAAAAACSPGQSPGCDPLSLGYTDRLFALSDGTLVREDVHLAHCVDGDVAGHRLDPRLHRGDQQLLPPSCWGQGWKPRRTTWVHRAGDVVVIRRGGGATGGTLAIVDVAGIAAKAPAVSVTTAVLREADEWVGADGAGFVVAHHDTWSFKGGGEHNVVFERFSLAGAAAWSTGFGGAEGRLQTAWLDDQGQVQALLSVHGGAKGKSQTLRWLAVSAGGVASESAVPALWPPDQVGKVAQTVAIDGWPQRRLVVAHAQPGDAKAGSATSVAWVGAGGVLIARADGLEQGMVVLAALGRPGGTLRLAYRSGSGPKAVLKVQDFDAVGVAISPPRPLQRPGSEATPWQIRQVALRADAIIAVATWGETFLQPNPQGTLDTLVTVHDGNGALTQTLNVGVPGDDEPTAIAFFPDRLALVRKAAAVNGKVCAESGSGAALLPQCIRLVEVALGCQ